MNNSITRKQLVKCLQKIEAEKRIGKDIFFLETHYELKDAIGFSQYIFSKIRMITLIGELHEKSFSCEGKELSIPDYCYDIINKNPNARILLEYNNGQDPEKIGSEIIRTLYSKIKKIQKTNQIIPYDVRGYFLGSKGQNDLYGKNFKNYDSPDKILDAFIKPFYKKYKNKQGNIFSLYGKYNPYIKKYLLEDYYNHILQQFSKATYLTVNNQNPLQILKDAWKEVSDYFILSNILKEDNIDEYIVISGKAHYINIQNIINKLPNFFLKLNNQEGSSLKCVNLYKTYKL